MADDATARIAALLLGGPQNPSITDMRRYVDRTPALADLNQGQSIVQPLVSPTGREILPEAAAVADPFGVSQVQRWLGSELPPMVRINEGHGLVKRELERLRRQGR